MAALEAFTAFCTYGKSKIMMISDSLVSAIDNELGVLLSKSCGLLATARIRLQFQIVWHMGYKSLSFERDVFRFLYPMCGLH